MQAHRAALAALFVASCPALVTLSCAELRRADEPRSDASSDDDGRVAEPSASDEDANRGGDAGESDVERDAAPPPCDGPCPPEVLATGLFQATTIAVDDNNIYFAVESGNGTVYQCPKTGCVGSPIVLGAGFAMGLVVDATRVYWGDFAAGKLVACTIGGCANSPTVVAANQPYIRGVWSDGESLFWTVNSSGSTVRRCSATGSCVPSDVVSDTIGVTSVAVDQGKLFFARVSDRNVYACATPSCTDAMALGPGTHGLAAQGNLAFWINGPTKTVVSCSTRGCAGAPLTIGSSTTPNHPISDGKHVYWRDDFRDEIYRCLSSGCAPGPDIVARKQRGQPGGNLAVDGRYLYWTTTSGVYRLPK